MKKGFKKGITLVEMIVSVAIISLISIMLLGILVPAINIQKKASEIDQSTYNAADEIEKKIYSMQKDSSDFSDASAVDDGEEHSLTFSIGGDNYSCGGKLYTSTDGEVVIKAFVPDKPEDEG